MEQDVELNELQEDFIHWTSEDRGISLENARERFLASLNLFPGGHRGPKFRRFCGLSYTVFSPFVSDRGEELEDAYRFHGPLHFLRMLSYGYAPVAQAPKILSELSKRETVAIIDYGCGLAQGSFWFARELGKVGVAVRLNLVDFETDRKRFLLWKAKKEGFACNFFPAEVGRPVPALPPSDLCIATEFFEHVHEPWRYFEVIDHALSPGAHILTNIADHRDEFMHVSPDLQRLRDAVEAKGYEHIEENRVIRKRG